MSESDKIQLTSDEMTRLGEALKKEEFRKLLTEYAQEISDPENRKRNEEEIAQLERERGFNVKFVKPKAGFVVKTERKTGKDTIKAFINIATSPEIVEASPGQTAFSASGKRGNNWSIPYSLSPPRDDIDRRKQKCVIYDCIYHPNTYKRGMESEAFKNTLITNAIEGIERAFKVNLDRNYTIPKSKYKGSATSTIIREKDEKAAQQFEVKKKTDPVQKLIGYPPIDERNPVKIDPSIPKHSLKYRNYVDLKDYTEDPEVTRSLPKEIIVTIELPKLNSAANIELDIQTRELILLHDNPKYSLTLTLSYDVDADQTLAKFDKDTKQLEVILPIKHKKKSIPPPRDIPETIPLEVGDTNDDKISQNEYNSKLNNNNNNINNNNNNNDNNDNDNNFNSNNNDDNNNNNSNSTVQDVGASLSETTSRDTSSSLQDIEANSIEKNTCGADQTATEVTIDNTTKATTLLTDTYDSDDLGSEDEQSFTINSKKILESEVKLGETINTSYKDSVITNNIDILADTINTIDCVHDNDVPNYKHRQTDSYVQFVFLAREISPQSITVIFRQNQVEISYKVGSTVKQDIYIEFPENNQINLSKSVYKLTPESLILNIVKLQENAGMWESFKIGKKIGGALNEKFLTKNSLLDEMKTRNDPWDGDCQKPREVKINSENPVKLTVTFDDKISNKNADNKSEKLATEMTDNENYEKTLNKNKKPVPFPKLTNTLMYQLDD